MKQRLPGYWTIQIESDFGHEVTPDGFTIVDTESTSLWIVVYEDMPWNPVQAVDAYLEDHFIEERFPTSIAVDSVDAMRVFANLDKNNLRAFAARSGRVIELDVTWRQPGGLQVALQILETLQWEPPDWVSLCVCAEPPLVLLWEELERAPGFIVSSELQSQIYNSDQASDALLILRKALDSPEVSVRLTACSILPQLGPIDAITSHRLESALHDDNNEVRAAAAQALSELGGRGENQPYPGLPHPPE